MVSYKHPDEIVNEIRNEFEAIKSEFESNKSDLKADLSRLNSLCQKVNENIHFLPQDLKDELAQAFIHVGNGKEERFLIDL